MTEIRATLPSDRAAAIVIAPNCITKRRLAGSGLNGAYFTARKFNDSTNIREGNTFRLFISVKTQCE